ncbi:hypothetical protein [Microbacterium sp. G2-8]|uniref:hypothetical protein n=1 Tax=Microbacterium sp. G2-8 TaxID=2842454 RepID=UPI001C8974CD|nr:hypothetical protein [Microbacterium sp. G2-8]
MVRASLSRSPILRGLLVWSATAFAFVLITASLIGLVVEGPHGLWSAVIAAVVGLLFPAMTIVAIVVAARWSATSRYAAIFFGVFMIVILLKIVVFLGALTAIFVIPWIVTGVVYGVLVVTAVASLVVDVRIVSRIRVRHSAYEGADPADPRGGEIPS